jgi:hypothetical protein
MRHKAIATSLTLACCIAFALAAQAPSAGTKGQGKEISLTGCLEAGTEPNTFVLKNVSTETAAGSEAKPPELAKTESEYTLTPAGKVNLKGHVGQKVEVTGLVMGQKQSKRGESEAAHTSHFRVKSIKQVSPDCP